MSNVKGIVLLEGADGTGKTTLGKYLVKKFDGHYMHLTYRWKQKMFHYHAAALHRAVKLSKDHLVVLDRQWISESVYAEAYRGGSYIPHSGRMFDRVLLKHGAVYVYCLAHDQREHDKHFEELRKERSEMFDNVSRVSELYTSLYFGSNFYPGRGYARDIAANGGARQRPDSLAYRYQVEGQHLDVFCETISDLLSEFRSTQYGFALNPGDYNFLGHAGRASFLMIGDRINKTNRQIDWPWFAHANSSLFLAQAMSELGLSETHFCYTNVNDPLGFTHARNAIDYYNLRPIALGRTAQKLLGVEDEYVMPHPSFGRRFGGDVSLWAEQLSGVLESAL